MTRLLIAALILLTLCPLTQAREFTKPPSIALRTEISYVSEVNLTAKNFIKNDTWQLVFDHLNDIHNTATETINIKVDNELANSLATDQKYIIAYHTHRKTKVDGIATYLPLDNGPRLAGVQGANPAIFRYDELLLEQIKSKPELTVKNPKALIETILKGMQSQDPKLQEFFVRELINWVDLPTQLTASDAAQILQVFNSPDISTGSLIAVLENRTAFHQLLGVENLAAKTSQLLTTMPVNLTPDSELPSLIFEALNFFIKNNLGNWDLYSRWILSNNSSITEKALLQLHQLNPSKTAELVHSKLNNTLINDTSRRVLDRYHRKHHSH